MGEIRFAEYVEVDHIAKSDEIAKNVEIVKIADTDEIGEVSEMMRLPILLAEIAGRGWWG